MIFHNFFNPWQGSCFFIYSYALFGLLAPLYIPYMLLCALLLATVNIYMIYAYQKKKKKEKKEKKEEKSISVYDKRLILHFCVDDIPSY